MSERVDPGRATEARLRRKIAKREEFERTPIGAAYRAAQDAQYEAYKPLIATSRFIPSDEAIKKNFLAHSELLKLLYEAAGVGEYDDGR